jgi:UPF0716 protein FxsA
MWLKLAFLAVPLVEIALYVVIGGAIGLWPTLAWVVLSAVLGIFILKRASRFGNITFGGSMQALGKPKSQPARRVMQILAGVMLILPGFLTDTIGLLLLFPPIQLVIIGLLASKIAAYGQSRPQGMTVEGDWREVEPGPDGSLNGSDPASQPSDLTRH